MTGQRPICLTVLAAARTAVPAMGLPLAARMRRPGP